MKIRTFSKLLTALASVLLPTVVFGAIAFENYESIVVPQLRKYPNYGFFWGFHLGYNKITSFDLAPNGTLFVFDMMTGDVTSETEVDVPNPDMTLSDGFAAGITMGFRNKNFRIEEELSVRYNTFDTITFDDWTHIFDCSDHDDVVVADGQLVVVSLMTNLYWDYLLSSYFVPFIGAGVGPAFMINNGSMTLANPATTMTPEFSDNGIGIAWQVMVGGAIILNDHAEIGIVYKFFQARPTKYTTDTYATCCAGSIDCGAMSEPLQTQFTPTYTAQTLAIEFRNTP